ncbi:unnamed protein product [Symbiodinium natans]|uniref:Uncharacterized protein n=1 Tax=Symbiodinium natans TaxID=878477 RepID=A0A812KAJ9_9DINO|nr:unnamed protein product [Symbiodinium natans]
MKHGLLCLLGLAGSAALKTVADSESAFCDLECVGAPLKGKRCDELSLDECKNYYRPMSAGRNVQCGVADNDQCLALGKGGKYCKQRQCAKGKMGGGDVQSIGGGGWCLVRSVSTGDVWFPDTDQLTEFESDDFVDFMFATGDLKKWMVMAKDQVYGTYNNGERDIKSSWQNAGPHKARMYRRRGHNEDPWISDTDHGTAVRNDDSNAVLYGENNFKSNRHAYNVRHHDGAAVYIRYG